jgi:hypothetical protein
MTEERWLPVVGWEGLYEVSDHGRVRSLDRTVEMSNPRWGCNFKRFTAGRLLSLVSGRGSGRGWKGSGDYHAVNLSSQDKGRKKVMVHRLVLTAFVGPDPTNGKMDGAHLDGNTLNNLLENLRWATRLENMADMKVQNRKAGPANSNWSSLKPALINEVWDAYERGSSFRSLVKKTGLRPNRLSRVLHDKDYAVRNFGFMAPAPVSRGWLQRYVFNALKSTRVIGVETIQSVAATLSIEPGKEDRRYEKVLATARDLENSGKLSLPLIPKRPRESRITADQLAQMRQAKARGVRYKDIAQQYGLCLSQAAKLITGKRYVYA